MSSRATFLLLSVLWIGSAFGDGPPMTPDGEVTVDHLEFHLSPEQAAIVGRTRYVEFNAEQLALCRKLNAKFPDRLPVIGPAFADCTCGMGAYGMWIRPQRIAIPTNTITGYDPEIEKELEQEKSEAFFDERALKMQAQTDPAGAAAARRGFCMDGNGKLFIYGKELELSSVATVLSKIATDKENDPYVFVNIPPIGDASIDAKVQEVLKNIRAVGSRLGVKILITG